MKTTKAKAAQEKNKNSGGEKPVNKKKTPPVKTMPGEEEIREKAREIYFERIARGDHGTPEDDWREAEDLLMGS